MKEFIEKLKAAIMAESYEDGTKEMAYRSVISVKSALDIVDRLAAEQPKGGWIPFTEREMDEEEKENFGVEEGYILNCPTPEDGQEILVTYSNSCVSVDTFIKDGNECYLDSGNELVIEALAWQPMPEAYKPEEER